MKTILFLYHEGKVSMERRGYVNAFLENGVQVHMLRDYSAPPPDLHALVADLESKPDLIIWPDDILWLPESLANIDTPTMCFHFDTYSVTKKRIEMSMLFDYAIVLHPGYEKLFQEAGHPRTIMMPHAVEASLFSPSPQDERCYEVGWVGHVRRTGNQARKDLLPRLAALFRMNDWGRYYPPEEMAEVYKKSKIVINISRDDYPQDANLRVFEAMAAGALLITRLPSELTKLGFMEREHFVGYEDPEQIFSLARYYLDNDTERQSIAQRAQEIVLRDHTYGNRVRQLLTILQSDNGGLFAPARAWTPDKVRRRYLSFYAQSHMLDQSFEELRKLRQFGLRPALSGIHPLLKELVWQIRIGLRLKDSIRRRA